ncbi:hypothetical protein L1887_34476 [Cichorium endivia]|nr:hypothetical protein L1887_34476 [Cichorium endivia]
MPQNHTHLQLPTPQAVSILTPPPPPRNVAASRHCYQTPLQLHVVVAASFHVVVAASLHVVVAASLHVAQLLSTFV